MLHSEAVPVSIDVRGEGRAYEIDCWNSTKKEADSYRAAGGVTRIDTAPQPGQAKMFCIDLGAGAGERRVVRAVTGRIALPVWDLTVEDWNEGAKREIVEDRGTGLVKREVEYETAKTLLPTVRTALKPWKDIDGVGPCVSGVGTYETTVTLPDDYNEDGSEKAYLDIESVHDSTLAVYVNGVKAGAVDFCGLQPETGDLLHPGENSIRVEVTTSLNNRLIERGYYRKAMQLSMMLAASANNGNSTDMGADAEQDQKTEEGEGKSAEEPSGPIRPRIRDYGMTGKVELVTYREQ